METQEKTHNSIMQLIKQSTGCPPVYHHSLFKSLWYSPGVRTLAQEAGMYWFLDVIASYVIDKKYHNLRYVFGDVKFQRKADEKECNIIIHLYDSEGQEPIIIAQKMRSTDSSMTDFELVCNITEDSDGNLKRMLCFHSED